MTGNEGQLDSLAASQLHNNWCQSEGDAGIDRMIEGSSLCSMFFSLASSLIKHSV